MTRLEAAPTGTQEGVNEVVAWAAFDLEADFMAVFANERAVSSCVERAGGGAIHPLVRQSALTACQQEVERLRELIDGDGYPDPDKIDALFQRAESAEADRDRMKEVIGAADGIRRVIKEMGIKRTPGLYQAIMAFDIARAALGGQSDET